MSAVCSAVGNTRKPRSRIDDFKMSLKCVRTYGMWDAAAATRDDRLAMTQWLVDTRQVKSMFSMKTNVDFVVNKRCVTSDVMSPASAPSAHVAHYLVLPGAENDNSNEFYKQILKMCNF